MLARADLRRHGVHPRRLASAEFVDLFTGYVTTASRPATIEAIGAVLTQERLPGALLSHTTAAEVLGLPLPPQHLYTPGGTLHITVPSADRRRAGPQVIVHRLRCPQREPGSPLPVVVIPTVLCGIAAMLSELEMVTVLEHLLGSSGSRHRVTPLLMEGFFGIGTPVRGKAALEAAYRRAVPGSRCPEHARIRRVLRGAGLPPPSLDLEVETNIPGMTVTIDMAYPERRVAILWALLPRAGSAHGSACSPAFRPTSSSPSARHRDLRRRQADLIALGWEVLVLQEADLQDPATFVRVVRAALRRSTSWRGGVTR